MLALFGPTAAGKSAVAHALALELGGEVVVADPFQRYRGLEIASDAPRGRDVDQVAYHLVGDLDLCQDSTAGDFALRAHAAIDDILGRGCTPIVAGGTGLYLRAALYALDMRPPPDPEVRRWAESLAADPQAAIQELHARDPEAAAAVDAANPRRLARALERAASGHDAGGDDLWAAPPRVPCMVACVDRPPAVLARLIADRVAREMRDGLVDELRAALDRDDLARGPRQVIGMAEVQAMERGELAANDLPGRLEARTRRLARMQRTWMRRMPVHLTVELADRDAASGVAPIAAAWRRSRGAVV